MKISYKDLLGFLKNEPSKDEISKKLFQLGHEHEINGDIFDIEFTPNRGDCLSVHGLARDLNIFYGNKPLNIVSQSSPTGTQYLQAVGTAFAMQRYQNGNVVYVSSGDGTTSQGDFHEALNWASREKAPVIFHIENNHYAISVPLHEQVANGQLYDITSGYDNLGRYNINGTDFFESHLAFKKAVDR